MDAAGEQDTPGPYEQCCPSHAKHSFHGVSLAISMYHIPCMLLQGLRVDALGILRICEGRPQQHLDHLRPSGLKPGDL